MKSFLLNPFQAVPQPQVVNDLLGCDGINPEFINTALLAYKGTPGFGFVYNVSFIIAFDAPNAAPANISLLAYDTTGALVFSSMTTNVVGGDVRIAHLSGVALGHKGDTTAPIMQFAVLLGATGSADVTVRMNIVPFRQLPEITNSIT